MLGHLPAMHKTLIQSQLYKEGSKCLKESKTKEKKKELLRFGVQGHI